MGIPAYKNYLAIQYEERSTDPDVAAYDRAGPCSFGAYLQARILRQLCFLYCMAACKLLDGVQAMPEGRSHTDHSTSIFLHRRTCGSSHCTYLCSVGRRLLSLKHMLEVVG